MSRKHLNLIGRQFGQLTVIQLGDKTPIGRQRWICNCSCGNTTTAIGQNLLAGTAFRCRKCASKAQGNTMRKFNSRIHARYTQYRFNAKARSLEFSISEEEFSSTIQERCHYCGAEPPNGIDRIDSGLGYILSNIRPCCKICNKAKSNMPEIDFIKWLDRIVEYRKIGQR